MNKTGIIKNVKLFFSVLKTFKIIPLDADSAKPISNESSCDNTIIDLAVLWREFFSHVNLMLLRWP